jgi:CRP-like cAMP-binding protein
MVTPEEIFGKRYEKGEIIFREGDAGDTMYVIMSGEVEISRERKGERTVLARMKRGEFFGEMSLMDDMPRSATVTALHRTRLLPMTRRSLFERAEEDPAVLVRMLGALSTRILKANPLIQSLVKSDETLGRAWAEGRAEPSFVETRDDLRGASRTDPAVNRIESDAPAEAPGSEDLLFPYDPASLLRFAPGRTIFREGDEAEELYFIVEGRVEITLDRDGEARRVALLHPFDFFGEMALITGKPRSANAVAFTETALLSVHRDEFLSKIRSKPEFGLFVLQILVSRLRSMLARPSHRSQQ